MTPAVAPPATPATPLALAARRGRGRHVRRRGSSLTVRELPAPADVPTVAVGIDEAGNVLGQLAGNPPVLPDGGAFHLRGYLGTDVTRWSLSRAGAHVLGLGPGGLYVLRGTDRRVWHVAPAGGPWQFDEIAPMSARGVIAAHARNVATGWTGAVLLTPAR